MDVGRVQLGDERGRIRIAAASMRCEPQTYGRPVLPVLNDDVDRDVVVAIAVLDRSDSAELW